MVALDILASQSSLQFGKSRRANAALPSKSRSRSSVPTAVPSPSSPLSRAVMGKSWRDCGKISDADPSRAVAFLRRRHPVRTAELIAAETGIKADTVRKWLEGASAPSFVAYSRMICAFGPEFLVAALTKPPAWLDAAVRAERQRQLEAEIASRKRELATMCGERA